MANLSRFVYQEIFSIYPKHYIAFMLDCFHTRSGQQILKLSLCAQCSPLAKLLAIKLPQGYHNKHITYINKGSGWG